MVESLENQCELGSLNILKPVEIVIKAMQQMIDAVICQLEWAVGFLTNFRLPELIPNSHPGSDYKIKPNIREDFVNMLDFPRVLLELHLNAIRSMKTFLFKLLELPLAIATKPLSLFVGFTVYKFNLISDLFQPFVPISLPKLVSPFGGVDWSKWEPLYPVTNFYDKFESLVPRPLRYTVDFFKNRLPGFRIHGKGISQVEKYNKELLDLLEKERQQHYKELSKLTACKENDGKVDEILEKNKREYDALKQELLDKIADEMEQHKKEVESIKDQSGIDKGIADDKINRITNDFEKEKQALQDKIDRLIAANKDDKASYEDKLQKLELDCKKLTTELQEKLNAEQQKKEELEKLKGDSEKDKTSYFEKVAKERETHQKEIDDLLTQKREDKIKSDEQIAQLNKELANQKQSFQEQLEKQRKECEAEIEKAKTDVGTGDSRLITLLKKTNQSLEEQKQDLTTKLAKEREQYLQELDKSDTKCRNEKAAADAKIDQLTKDLANQKQELVGELDKQRKTTDEQIKKALDDQKVNYEKENANLRKELEDLKTKCAALDKDKGIFGKINDTLSKPADVADKVTKPLQETGFGKIFG